MPTFSRHQPQKDAAHSYDVAQTERRVEELVEEIRKELLPAKAVVGFNLTADDVSGSFNSSGLGKSSGLYDGWAICNGNNGTPDLSDKFVRLSVAVAGGTGGSDAQTHTLSDAGGAEVNLTSETVKRKHPSSGPSFSYDDIGTLGASGGSGTIASTPLLGSTDSADNMPAYYGLVPLMRVN